MVVRKVTVNVKGKPRQTIERGKNQPQPKKGKETERPPKAAPEATPPKNPPTTPPVSPPKSPPKETVEKYSRSLALHDAYIKGGTRKQIVENADKLFVEKGGESNVREADFRFSLITPVLLKFGVINPTNA